VLLGGGEEENVRTILMTAWKAITATPGRGASGGGAYDGARLRRERFVGLDDRACESFALFFRWAVLGGDMERGQNLWDVLVWWREECEPVVPVPAPSLGGGGAR
jgi:hypothetical protein